MNQMQGTCMPWYWLSLFNSPVSSHIFLLRVTVTADTAIYRFCMSLWCYLLHSNPVLSWNHSCLKLLEAIGHCWLSSAGKQSLSESMVVRCSCAPRLIRRLPSRTYMQHYSSRHQRDYDNLRKHMVVNLCCSPLCLAVSLSLILSLLNCFCESICCAVDCSLVAYLQQPSGSSSTRQLSSNTKYGWVWDAACNCSIKSTDITFCDIKKDSTCWHKRGKQDNTECPDKQIHKVWWTETPMPD